MAISLIQPTNIIYVPKADTTLVSASPDIRSLDMNFFHNELRTLETLVENDVYEITHEHSAPSNIGQVTLQRVVKIIGLWEVEFEDTGTPYAVRLIGGNNNIEEVTVVNNVSVRPSNSAGAIVIETGTSGLTPGEALALAQAVNLMEADEYYDKNTGLLHMYLKGTTIDLITPKDVTGALTAGDVSLIQP